MCCRYWADESPELRSIVEEMNRSPLVDKWRETTEITLSGEIRPTDVVPVIASSRSGTKAVFPMRWGFNGRTRLMNARVETAPVKATFKEAWAAHRCIVPASWYFEWEHILLRNGKTRTGGKYRIQPSNSTMTWLCGLYRLEEGLPVFVVLTRAASDSVRSIHDRMPLIMPEDHVDAWIRPDADPDALAAAALTEMTCVRVDDMPSAAPEYEQLSFL